MEKLEILLSLIYFDIYHVVDVMHGKKKVKKFQQTNQTNFHQQKKKEKKKKKKAILNFYWDRDIAGKSIKTKTYKKNEYEKTRDYLKLNFKHPEYSF